MELSIQELRDQVCENFDNRSYTINEIEDTMNLRLISLINDIPYAPNILDSIFSLNPFK